MLVSEQRDPVEFWLGRVGVSSAKVYRSALNRFLEWLRQRGGEWTAIEASALLERQKRAGSEDAYVILDLLQEWVSKSEKAKKSKQLDYGAVISFFLHNRCALPRDPSFKIKASKPSVAPRLTVNHVLDLVKGANLRDRSILLVRWMAMLDHERLAYLCENLAEQIVTQMRNGVNPVRLDFPSRKQNENPWYDFIGKDAVDALREYFEKERGWPKPGEPVWPSTRGEALTTSGLEQLWMRLTRRIGLVPKKRGSVGSRYGYNSHETRDVAKSLLHTHALKDGFDMVCSEFWLGHTIDKYGYDKFFLDQEYVRKQYLIAEKYLNILSVPQASEQVKRQEEELKKMQDRLEKLEAIYSEKLKIKES